MAVWSTLAMSVLAPGTRLDAEYYQPRFLQSLERLSAFDCRSLNCIAYVTDGIHSSPDEVDEGGVRYLSAKCVKDNDFSLGDALRISEAQHAANPRTSLRIDDVLITTVGTIGNAAVAQPDLLPANADRHLGIIRIKEEAATDPYFLAAFLNSEFGRFQSLREATGSVQLNLFIEKIKTLLVPSLRCAGSVSNLTREAYSARLEAAAKVLEAEALVSLGLGTVNLSPSKTYALSLQQMLSGNRFGAEFYMPAKFRVLQSLAKSPYKPLSEYVENVRQSWSPQSSTVDKVRNFDLTHALEPFLDDRIDPVEISDVGSAKKRLRFGDVVISRLRSYLKQIAVVRCSDNIPAVGSSEFIVLRPKGKLRAEALLAFLRSDLVQTILRWSQDGTNHPRFDEQTLLAIPVPDRLVEAQGDICGAVEDGIAARQAMIGLLAQGRTNIQAELLSGR
jgi:type I restriction enzyme S subunit